jgi:hypothetical protein
LTTPDPGIDDDAASCGVVRFGHADVMFDAPGR